MNQNSSEKVLKEISDSYLLRSSKSLLNDNDSSIWVSEEEEFYVSVFG